MIAVARDFERMRDYIVGRLSEVERRAFENRLVREPALVRELEESLRLSEGLRELRAERIYARPAPARSGVRAWLPALAAAAVAGFALFLWGDREESVYPVLTASPHVHTGAAVGSPITAAFTFVTTRGDNAPNLQLPEAGLIEILAAPRTRAAHLLYRAGLFRLDEAGSAEPIGSLATLRLRPDGYLHFFADASRLEAGRYLLRLQSEKTTSAQAAEFSFNLRAGGSRAAR